MWFDALLPWWFFPASVIWGFMGLIVLVCDDVVCNWLAIVADRYHWLIIVISTVIILTIWPLRLLQLWWKWSNEYIDEYEYGLRRPAQPYRPYRPTYYPPPPQQHVRKVSQDGGYQLEKTQQTTQTIQTQTDSKWDDLVNPNSTQQWAQRFRRPAPKPHQGTWDDV